MTYEMKKLLRRGTGYKSYAEPDEEEQENQANRQKETQRESIFEHKNWTLKQKVKLMIFLSHYHMLRDWNSERRSIRLYKHLSNFLKKSRTPEQCKNIHSLLKRKFNSFEEVVDAMEKELHSQENYAKFVSKYERQIQKFEANHYLFADILDTKIAIEPIRFRKFIEKEQKQEPKGVFVKEYQESQKMDIKIGDHIKHEDIEIDKPINRLTKECQYYFTEWLKCVSIIDYKNKTMGKS